VQVGKGWAYMGHTMTISTRVMSVSGLGGRSVKPTSRRCGCVTYRGVLGWGSAGDGDGEKDFVAKEMSIVKSRRRNAVINVIVGGIVCYLEDIQVSSRYIPKLAITVGSQKHKY